MHQRSREFAKQQARELEEQAEKLDARFQQWRAITLVPCPVCNAGLSEHCKATSIENFEPYSANLVPGFAHPARILLSKLIRGDPSFFEPGPTPNDAFKLRPYPKR